MLQIILLGLGAAVGMTVRQLPSFSFRSASAYNEQMALMHQRYDPALGASAVDFMERLQVFNVFSSWWFSLSLVVLMISIVVCTLDRTPRLWRQATDIRVVQPEPYFDLRLPDRAAIVDLAPAPVREVMRRHHFRVREASADGLAYLYGDRHQYTKMATLLTHLGLIMFLVAAAVTSRFGFEAPIVVASGETSTVQAIGTPNLLVVKNLGFAAPLRPDGSFADFSTDLAVYQNGVEIGRKTIHVNDPMSIAGFTFHQNGFGPAPFIKLRDRAGNLLYDGAVTMTDQSQGLPFATMGVPGRDVGLEMYLQKAPDGTAVLFAVPYRVTGTSPDGKPIATGLFPLAVGPGETASSPDVDFTLTLSSIGSYSLLIAKQDPGQGIVWLAFGLLLSGILITFYFPRRRVWARIGQDGEMRIAGRSDRYVDFEREFGKLLDDLVAQRGGTTGDESAPARPAPPAPPAPVASAGVSAAP